MASARPLHGLPAPVCCGRDATPLPWSTVTAVASERLHIPGTIGSSIGAGVIPTNGGAHCVFVAVPPARFRDEIRHDIAAGYSRALGELSASLAADVASARFEAALSVFAGRRGLLREAWGPGWALVGDAGYFKDPLTAHGMTDALRDAELLAVAAVQGSASAFAAYAAQREALSRALFEITDAIASFAWDLDTVRQWHRELNTAMKHEAEYLAALSPLGTAMFGRRRQHDRHIIDHRNRRHGMGADDQGAARNRWLC